MKITFKKTVSILIVAMMMAGVIPAVAQEASFTAKGTITPIETVMLLAPMSGRVKNFSLLPGDSLMAGDTVLSITPYAITAASSGTVKGLWAQAGDNARAVTGIYGALMSIERQGVWHVDVSTRGGYNAVENRDILIGDTLRVQMVVSGDKTNGIAKVIAKTAEGFSVEMDEGDFELEDNVKFYLGDGKDYTQKYYVGSGKITRPNAVAVMGEGTIAKVLVSEGEKVKRGQTLLYLDAEDTIYSDNNTTADVRSEVDAVVSQVFISPGQMVAKGQAVLAIYPSALPEAQLSVDELDITKVKEGQHILVSVDAFGEQTRQGVVKKINPIGVSVLDTTKFIVTVELEDTQGLMLGMQVKGIWE